MSTPYELDESKQGVLYILELETTNRYAYWSTWADKWWHRERSHTTRKRVRTEHFIKIGHSTRRYDYDTYERRKHHFELHGLRIVDECRVYEMREWHSAIENELHAHWSEEFGYEPMWQGFSGYTECYVPELKSKLNVIDDMVRESVNRYIDEQIDLLESDRNAFWNV